LHRRALDANSDAILSWYAAGGVLEEQGLVRQACAAYEEAVRRKPDYLPARLGLARALERLGSAQRSLEQWNEALRVDPSLVEARIRLSRHQLRRGNAAQALRHLKIALLVDPQNLPAHEALAQAYEVKGMSVRARHWRSRAKVLRRGRATDG